METDLNQAIVLENLTKAWKVFPNFRLGQLIFFLATDSFHSDNYKELDIWGIPDETFVVASQELIKEKDEINGKLLNW